MDKVNQKMKRFNFKGVLGTIRSSVQTPQRNETGIEESLKSEHFQIGKIICHGFPYQPTSLACDPVQNLLAVGNKNGIIKIIGKPGVEYDVKHESGCSVVQLIFLINEGSLVSVTADDQLHMWTLRQKKPELVHSLKFQRERISICHLPFQSKWLYVGTERGNVQIVNLESFTLSGYIINWNKAMDLIRLAHPGPVVHLSDNPIDPNKLLIGFETGSVVLWDLKAKAAEMRFSCSESLKSVCWHQDGKQFICSHGDGSLTVWNIKQTQRPQSYMMPHAKLGKDGRPEQCKAITKVDYRSVRNGEPFIIFNGGTISTNPIPSLTVMHGNNMTVLEMEHSVVDFLVLCATPWNNDFQDPHAVVALLQNDLVVVDLTSPGYPCFENPYPMDIHESPVTTCCYLVDCPMDLVPAFYSVGVKRNRSGYSEKEWPINGGEWDFSNCNYPEIIITGHADGSVKFWDASGVTLQVLYKLKTAKVFEASKTRQQGLVDTDTDEEDDSPFAVQHIYLCVESRLLCVAGTSHAILFRFSKQEAALECPVIEISIVYEVYDGSTTPDIEHPIMLPPKHNLSHQSGSLGSYSNLGPTNGKESVTSVKARSGIRKWPAGYQPEFCCLLTWIDNEPSPPITSLSLNSKFGLLAFGDECGIAIVDIIQKTCLLSMGTPDLYGSLDPYSRAPRSPKLKSSLSTKLSTLEHLSQTTLSDDCRSPTIEQMDSPNTPILHSPKNRRQMKNPHFTKKPPLANLSPQTLVPKKTKAFKTISCPYSSQYPEPPAIQINKTVSIDEKEEWFNDYKKTGRSYLDRGQYSHSPEDRRTVLCANDGKRFDNLNSNNRNSGLIEHLASCSSGTDYSSFPESNCDADVEEDDGEYGGGGDERGDGGGDDKDEDEDIDEYFKKYSTNICGELPEHSEGEEGKNYDLDEHQSERDGQTSSVNNLTESAIVNHANPNNLIRNLNSRRSQFMSNKSASEDLTNESFEEKQKKLTEISAKRKTNATSSPEVSKCDSKTDLIQKGLKNFAGNSDQSNISPIAADHYSSHDALEGHKPVKRTSKSFSRLVSGIFSKVVGGGGGSVSSNTSGSTTPAINPNNLALSAALAGSGLAAAGGGGGGDDDGTGGRRHRVSGDGRGKKKPMKFDVMDLTCDDPKISHTLLTYHIPAEKSDNSFCRSHSSSTASLENVNKESIVYLAFAEAYTRKSDLAPCPCLWLGTSLGSVLVISLTLPSDPEMRKKEPLIISPSGTIFRLKGSILTISFLDCNGVLIPTAAESWRDVNNKEGGGGKEDKKSQYNKQSPSLRSRISPTSSVEGAADKQYSIVCSEKQARVISLPSQTCVCKVKVTETSCVAKAEIIPFKDSVCLTCYVANGHIVVFSLPTLKPLLDVDYIGFPNIRVMKTICFSNYGHVIYMSSPNEIQKLTLSAEVCESLKENAGELYLTCNIPEAPKQSFLKNLFGNVTATTAVDREELFGESSGRPSKGMAKYTPGPAGLAQEAATQATSEIARAKMAALERGEKLGELEERTERMKMEAEMFSQSAHALKMKYKEKKWYQF